MSAYPDLCLEHSFVVTCEGGAGSRTLGNVICVHFPPHFIPQICSCLETISEATDMKEAVEIMPQTLEYGIINSHVLGLLKDIICQVSTDGKKNLSTV